MDKERFEKIHVLLTILGFLICVFLVSRASGNWEYASCRAPLTISFVENGDAEKAFAESLGSVLDKWAETHDRAFCGRGVGVYGSRAEARVRLAPAWCFGFGECGTLAWQGNFSSKDAALQGCRAAQGVAKVAGVFVRRKGETSESEFNSERESVQGELRCE